MNTNHSATPNKIKIFLALVAVFALTVTVTFAAHRVLSKPLDTQLSNADLKSAREETKAGIPRLPQDTEEKLAAALYPDRPVPANIADPFVDRTGLNNSSAAAVKTSAVMPSVSSPTAPEVPDRAARLSQWQQSLKSSVASGLPTPPMTAAYLVSEIAPTGQLEMNGRHGVFLYLESEKRTITADVGAKFYDGMLVGVTDQGAQFRTAAGRTKLVPWSRKEDFTNSSAPGVAPSLDVTNSPKQPTVIPVKPVSRLTRPAETIQPQDRYADLQEAVKDRYAQSSAPDKDATTPATLTPATTTAPPSAIVTSNESSTAPNTEAQPAEPNENQRPASFNHVVNLKPATDASPEPSPSPSASPSPTPVASPVTVSSNNDPVKVATPQTSPTASPIKADSPKPASENRKPVCDPSYRGERISITNESDRPLSLLALVNQLNKAYGANIVLDYEIQETPVRLTVNDTPWTSVLRTLLDLNDLDVVCLDGGIVQIAKRAKIAQISDQRRKSAPIVREVFKLRYLQPTAGGRANLAGQTQATNGANIQTLEGAIREILKAGGDARGEARQVPGHNEIFVAATQQQMDEVRDLIARVDRPGYQVKISALVYTANENRLRDIGSQLSIAAFNGPNINIGGFTTLPNTGTNTSGSSGTGSGSGSSNNSNGVGRNPGGIPGLATNMRQPSNGLGASNPLATFGGSVLFNSFQFAYQLTLAQNQGAVNIQSRPFGIVSDGDTFDLVAGTQIPVVTTTIAGGAPFQSGQVQFIEASRIARITPQVAEDEQGRPNFVTLNIQLENNSVDTSLGTFNGVPGVNRQSLQTVLRLRNGETVVIGGLTADQISNARSKVPGLADIPLIGNAFKKKQNQENRDRLYFAITAEVIPQEAPMPNFEAPADATTAQPLPPRALQSKKP
jgi:type II secretory pathway component GspD/PulD (secretin)